VHKPGRSGDFRLKRAKKMALCVNYLDTVIAGDGDPDRLNKLAGV